MLYHAEIYFPAKLKAAIPSHVIAPTYSHHAKQAAQSDRYGSIELPSQIDLSQAQVFEAEVSDGKLVKFAVRMSYDSLHDISIVIACNRDYFVKTVWLNRKTDKHRTLNRKNYASAS